MRFRQIISGVLVGALFFGALVAQGDEPPAVAADLGYASRFVFRGVARAGASAQAAVEFNRDDYSGGVWTNQPFDRGDTRELDLHGARTWKPATDLTLQAAVAQRWFSRVPGGGVTHSFEAGLTATLAPINGFTPRLACFHDFRFRADTAQVSLARSIALPKWGAFLELNFYAGNVAGDDWRPDAPGPRRHDSYRYWGGEARLPYRIGAHSTVTVGLHYADAFGRSAPNGAFGLSGPRNLWVTLGVNLDF